MGGDGIVHLFRFKVLWTPGVIKAGFIAIFAFKNNL